MQGLYALRRTIERAAGPLITFIGDEKEFDFYLTTSEHLGLCKGLNPAHCTIAIRRLAVPTSPGLTFPPQGYTPVSHLTLIRPECHSGIGSILRRAIEALGRRHAAHCSRTALNFNPPSLLVGRSTVPTCRHDPAIGCSLNASRRAIEGLRQ
jgi:hypothetical protein